MTTKLMLVTAALAALALGFLAGRATGDAGAHAQPREGARLVSIAVEDGAVYKAYDDESIVVCSATPAGVSCRPFR